MEMDVDLNKIKRGICYKDKNEVYRVWAETNDSKVYLVNVEEVLKKYSELGLLRDVILVVAPDVGYHIVQMIDSKRERED